MPDTDVADIYAYLQSVPKGKTAAEIPMLKALSAGPGSKYASPPLQPVPLLSPPKFIPSRVAAAVRVVVVADDLRARSRVVFAG